MLYRESRVFLGQGCFLALGLVRFVLALWKARCQTKDRIISLTDFLVSQPEGWLMMGIE